MEIASDREHMIRGVVDRYFSALSALDEEAWVAAHAPEAVSFVPVVEYPVESRDDLRRLFRGLAMAFDRMSIRPESLWVAADGAAVKWTASAMVRDGRTVAFDGIDVFEVDDHGRIRTVWSYWDPAALQRRLDDTGRPSV